MTSAKILAIDQGTTSTRAVIVDERATLTIVTAHPNPPSYPQAEHVEQDPERLLADLSDCIAQAVTPDIVAVGISNQGESCLAWEAGSCRPLAPILSWQDNRSQARVERLRANGAAPEIRKLSGLPLDAYFSASKLAWLLDSLPEARSLAARGRLHLGTTDAWFREALTGRFETDVTTASRTSLMNLTACAWDPRLCELFSVPMDALPAIGPSNGLLGMLKAGSREIPLMASLVDQQAALYGHGCRAPGDTKMTFGTGAFASLITGTDWKSGDAADEDSGAVPTVAWQKTGDVPVYAVDGGVYAAASAVDWGRSLGLFDDYAELNELTTDRAVSRGLVFVPALAGLGCPFWDRDARGSWMGLSADTTARDLMQAILEGIAYRMRDVVQALEHHNDVAEVLRVDGGMSANPCFCQSLADILGRDLFVSSQPERTALGTATLAAEAAGLSIDIDRQGRLVSPTSSSDRHESERNVARFAAARQAVQRYARE